MAETCRHVAEEITFLLTNTCVISSKINIFLGHTLHAKYTKPFYFYSKTNQMHNISNLFYFGTTLYMFQTVFPSIIRSLRLYIYLMLYVQS